MKTHYIKTKSQLSNTSTSNHSWRRLSKWSDQGISLSYHYWDHFYVWIMHIEVQN